jgi:hypothetical protein
VSKQDWGSEQFQPKKKRCLLHKGSFVRHLGSGPSRIPHCFVCVGSQELVRLWGLATS